MTTLTKILVVLVCLFAFIFTPMAISFAARTYNWRQLANEYQEAAETSLAHERAALATAATAIEQYKASRDQERNRADDAEQRVAALEQQVADVTQKRMDLERARDSWEASARRLSSLMDVVSTDNSNLREENERLKKSEQTLQAQLIQCEDDLADMSANNVILARYLQQRKEELASIRRENEQLREALRLGRAAEPLVSTPDETARPGAVAAQREIRGSVVEFNQARGIVQIDVGSNAGVAPGMIMCVVRDENYICDLEITGDVTPNAAIGRIVNPGGRQPRAGDRVVDEDTLMGRR